MVDFEVETLHMIMAQATIEAAEAQDLLKLVEMVVTQVAETVEEDTLVI
jgi:hypothetical protein